MKKLAFLPIIFLFFNACVDKDEDLIIDDTLENKEIIQSLYGIDISEFDIVKDTVRNGDTFGGILDANAVPNSKIFEVAEKFKDSFDVRRMNVGKPYVLFNSKDSTAQTKVFVYEKSRINYVVVDLRDTTTVFNAQKEVTYIEKEASGVITSSLSQTMEEENLSPYMSDKLSNIYAWTVNFFHLQAGDRFKVVYTEKFINDSISAGLHDIKAAYFEHRGQPLYAFEYQGDSLQLIPDYYDEEANNLRRAFLKAPVKFSRISSRYNLNRRIKYYGYKLRPHKGTDFAAPIGTPILATADGVVSKSEYRGGNGNYVKIRHNATYDTQYLHMKSRKVKVGDFVRQGEVIGYVGMTGNTGGPHVCYRFWKNGKQVDPFKQDLPASKPLPQQYREDYQQFITPLKEKLDCINY
ncbi:peptidase, M23/M37 family protein [unidentified eubacterium SCB49]|nr:peptidase, M23/M37 family protein [unidentified eubacterium SCB49]